MKMKYKALFCGGLMIAFFGLFTGKAQTTLDKREIKIKKRTLMAQFESDYVIPVEKRIALKKKRITYQRHTKRILDTLKISDRKRKRLLKELRKSPFSERITKVILAETRFEDDMENREE
ncbi:hypothetical protein [Maribacter sp. 2304DJ31-5]|uniref:hypothetical protein n=1 Tax=Maribacter sp. 2304DJ31-5 TaxID=3386273 RepID=UPI0039BD4834